MKLNEVCAGSVFHCEITVVAFTASINLFGGIFTEMATFSLELGTEMNPPIEIRVSITDKRLNLIKQTFFL